MKISPNWLREFVTVSAEDRALAERLTMSGVNVESLAQSGGKTVFEMDITTNRPDAMNHYGIAREIAAIYDVALKPLHAKLPEPHGSSHISVEINVPEYCARFTGQEIRNVKIGPALGGDAAKKNGSADVGGRFAELDQKPINNAADATNYVLLLMGKPTHAFDADKLAGHKIIVRMAKPGEKLKTLDGVERTLHPEDVVVADAEKAVALAGVMGGWDSMITASTKNVFIESAWWDPAAVRRTSRRHALHTDASHRFERGADFASCPLSTDLVAHLILESGGGELAGKQIDVIAREVGHPPVKLRASEVRRILGKEIAAQEIERILKHLGFKEAHDGKDAWVVYIPTWRLDVEREIDVIEEIARIHGYANFANTLPSFSTGVVELPHAAQQQKLRATLLALGYHEALTSTFAAESASRRFNAAEPVHIANPLSEEAAAMRTTLVPGMLDMVARNLNRDTESVRLFELGHIYAMKGADSVEQASLALGITAQALAVNCGCGPDDAETLYRSLRGDLEDLLADFTGAITFDANVPGWLHPGRSARMLLNGVPVAHFGQLHPDVAAARKFKQGVWIAEVAAEHLLDTPLRTPRYQRLSRYPAIERDFSFLFDAALPWQKIESTVRALGLAELRSLEPAEVYRGSKLPAGKQSLLVRATFQSHERTLTDDEVAAWAQKIIDALTKLGGTLRA